MTAALPIKVELRILSGPNLGALMELTGGSYVLGSGDACDFILSDSTVAARHLALTVEADGEGRPTVLAAPLDGEIYLAGESLSPEGRALPKAEALSLGFTALAWRPAGESWGAITLVPLEYAALAARGQAETDRPEASPGGEESAADEARPPEEGRDDDPGYAESAATLVAEIPRSRLRRGWSFWLGLGLVAVLLGLLFYSPARVAGDRERQAAGLARLFQERGLDGLTVEAAEESVVISGLVAGDGELAELMDLLSGQPYRIYLKVRVEDDLVKAVREALGAYGFRSKVGRSSGSGLGALTVAAYMKDGRVEAKAFGALMRDLPQTVNLTRRIVYADEVENRLSRSLAEEGLAEVSREYLDNRVQLSASLELDQLKKLNGLLEEVQTALKAPINFQLVDSRGVPEVTQPATRPRPGALKPAEATGPPEPSSPLGGLTIVGVTLSPMRFISMRDGQKYFEGAVLPSGYVIEEIRADEIMLSRNNLLTSYKLGGTDE